MSPPLPVVLQGIRGPLLLPLQLALVFLLKVRIKLSITMTLFLKNALLAIIYLLRFDRLWIYLFCSLICLTCTLYFVYFVLCTNTDMYRILLTGF